MNRKEKMAIRQHQSTRQLMGIQNIAPHGVTTPNSELVFFLVRPDNLSVLSAEGIRARVTALANLLRAEPAVELLVVDSRESFQRNKEFYQARLEEETTPALRKLLTEDMRHLDEILSSSASAREFVLILRRDLKSDMSESTLRQLEKGICDHGLHVRLADEQDVKRLLAVYYQHDVTTDFFQDIDGEKAVIGNDIIAGTFFLAGDTRSGDLCSLTQDQLQRFGELFAKPETFQPGEVEDALRIEFYSM